MQLIEMAEGVATGMAYLSAMSFIHRVTKLFCLIYVINLARKKGVKRKLICIFRCFLGFSSKKCFGE